MTPLDQSTIVNVYWNDMSPIPLKLDLGGSVQWCWTMFCSSDNPLATTSYVGMSTHSCALFWTLIHIRTYVAQGI
jgi:hypothetical protein